MENEKRSQLSPEEKAKYELDHDITLVAGPDGTLRQVKNRKEKTQAAQEIREEQNDFN